MNTGDKYWSKEIFFGGGREIDVKGLYSPITFTAQGLGKIQARIYVLQDKE